MSSTPLINSGTRPLSDSNSIITMAPKPKPVAGRSFPPKVERRLSYLPPPQMAFCAPKLGEIIISSEESYQYLAESIRMHPNQDELKDLFEDCGYKNCEYENLTNGIVAIHSVTKPKN